MKELLISLEHNGGIPLYEQIYQYIKTEIADGKIIAGEKLPSSRALSRQLSVSRSTVDLAYEQLESEGYLESRPCIGHFACDIEGFVQVEPNKGKTSQAPKRRREGYSIDFAVNGIDPGGFPQNIWRKISRQVLSDEDAGMFQLGDSQGEWKLREAIASYLHHARGVEAVAEQIVVGAGNDYLLMLLSMLLGKSSKIAMENPSYDNAWRCFRSLGHEVVSIPLDEAGMKPSELEESGARIAYVMPSHQFPMGMVMPLKRRLQLLAWAKRQSGRYLIEDDYDSEFRYIGKPIPALQGYDQHETVIYIGTFSKAIAPSIRISYMVLPATLLQQYRELGSNFSVTISKVDQKIIEIFLREGYFERHLNRMRALYKGKHDLILKNLKDMTSICQVFGENAGVHLLLKLKNGMTEEEACRLAKEAGIKVYPLLAYFPDCRQAGDGEGILLGYATLKEDEIQRGMNILKEVWS
ncbi:MocR-like pyridoxine biosynthesis transcription factor PdxR [Novisyntrophococcus fermenticellae]|uniref:MocR-like pyridoxine biosynthesis transcription factor PdxR n=1 Tax=Novisyntrophococcus fermenticellae TaxID=2068655 RepID=UPI001E59A149|nr:PLP-dependent aminotransferase family protein [Novisyntrophococcus fermenticellae]